ncbi:MAG: SusD/RagB family nutrient-binding outer membrane lipoprotein [Salinivirgaceae bacterium]|nr:SusD/RagB family nutrient-binding outer membrane lipoprotein [Salinivirgaceae bacterium]
MKKIKILYAVLLSIALLFTGCTKDWLDVNDDPNKTTVATPELTFPSGVMALAANVGGYYNLIGGFWSQYWSQSNSANQYKFLDQYQVQSGDFNTEWREMYAASLSDLNYTIVEAEKLGNNSYLLMATVMQVYGYQLMVDLYGDVPYFDALQGDADVQNFNPAFDDGQAVYDDLMARLDAALALVPTQLTEAQENADLIFGGDMDEWVKLGNTLKLKMYMRQMYVRPSLAQTGIEALYNSGAEFIAQDAAITSYINQEYKDNPLYASNVRKLNVGTNLRVSATLFRYLEGNSDPRIDHYVGSGTNPMPQGGFNIPTPQLDPTTVCVFAQSATDPVYFISEIESYLLQAEAIAAGWGTGDDKALYDAAITASFARYGEGASSFIAAGGAYEYPTAGTFEQKQEAIMMAKWVAFAGSQSIEMFFETNRTHYPTVSNVPSWAAGAYNDSYVGGQLTYSLEGLTGGDFPNRLIYPQDEVNLNTNFPGQTKVTDKIWWDTK